MARFRSRDTGAQVAGSQRDASPINCCVVGRREMMRLAPLLANQPYLRLLQDEFAILSFVPSARVRAAKPLLPVVPEPVALPAPRVGPVPEISASSTTERASISSAVYRGGDADSEGPRDVASELQSTAGSGCRCCCCCFLHPAYWLPTRKKLLYPVANPARGLLNRERRTQEKVWQHTPPFSPLDAARSEKVKSKPRQSHASTCLDATQVSVRLAPVQDSFDSFSEPMVVASQTYMLPCAITTFPVSLPLSSSGDI